jgi:hypothetical protein
MRWPVRKRITLESKGHRRGRERNCCRSDLRSLDGLHYFLGFLQSLHSAVNVVSGPVEDQ